MKLNNSVPYTRLNMTDSLRLNSKPLNSPLSYREKNDSSPCAKLDLRLNPQLDLAARREFSESMNNDKKPQSPPTIKTGRVIIDNSNAEQFKLARKREKRGECKSCGTKIFKIGVFGKKTPVNESGKVMKGRCLNCFPLEMDNYEVPHELHISELARHTSEGEISGITFIDHTNDYKSSMLRSDAYDDSMDMEYNFCKESENSCLRRTPTPTKGRPKDARFMSDSDEAEQPALPHRSPPRTNPSSAMSPSEEVPVFKPTRNQVIPWAPLTVLEEEGPLDCEQDYYGEEESKREIEAIEPFHYAQWHQPPHLERDSNSNQRENYLQSLHETQVDADFGPLRVYSMNSIPTIMDVSLESDGANTSGSLTTLFPFEPQSHSSANDIGENKLQTDRFMFELPKKKPPTNASSNGSSSATAAATATTTATTVSGSTMPYTPPRLLLGDQAVTSSKADNTRSPTSQLGVFSFSSFAEDVQNNLELLNNNGDRETRVSCLNELTSIMWSNGAPAKRLFVESNGIGTLTAAIWVNIEDPIAQEAALRLLLALTASSDGEAESDVMCGQEAEGCVDALLISMQTLEQIEGIQELGCRIICCLASASSNNDSVNDGSLSGAVQTVLNAMDVHRQCLGLQEWGARALYHQCVFSKHAEANKRAVASSTLKSGEKGPFVLQSALIAAKSEPVLAGRLCKLHWCLSASEDVAQMLSPGDVTIKTMLSIAHFFRGQKELERLVEAALGTVANLSKIQENTVSIIPDEVFTLALEIMRSHKGSAGIATEACCLIANLATVVVSVDTLVEMGALRIIFDVALSSSDDNAIEEGLRALVSITTRSDLAKQALLKPALYSKLTKVRVHFSNSVVNQTMYCILLSSIFQSNQLSSGALLTDLLESLSVAMAANLESKRVQTAACNALRAVSFHEEYRVALKSSIAVSNVVNAMEHHRCSKTIQLNACCFLRNVSSQTHGNDNMDSRCIGVIVEAIQSHLETSSVVEMACSALWSLIHSSDAMKERLARIDGGMDAVTCVLVMYPGSSALLEKAVGVLSSLASSKAFAKDIVSTQRIDCILDVMQNNSNSVEILTSSMLFLRNVIMVAPDYASAASGAVSVVIFAMKEHSADAVFQREACSLLWVMAAKDADCKAKILEMEGASVLMDTLENSDAEGVQDAALGAFNELALTATTSV